MEFFLRYRTAVVFSFLSLFCFTSLSVKSNFFTLTVESLCDSFVYPFQQGYFSLQKGASNIWVSVMELKDVKEKLKFYKEQVHNYKSKEKELINLRRENQRLTKLLETKKFISSDSLPANIISKNPENWFKTLMVDRGSNDGVQNNMPVISYQDGEEVVVGKVIVVKDNLSKVLPLNGLGLKVGVKLYKNNYPGLFSSLSDDSSLGLMDYVSREVKVNLGDKVVTSGQGGIFPVGITVGKVVKNNSWSSSTHQTILVQPAINYELLEDVFIIKKAPSKDFLELFEIDK